MHISVTQATYWPCFSDSCSLPVLGPHFFHVYIKITSEEFPINGVKRQHFEVLQMTVDQMTAQRFEARQRG